MPKGTGLAYSYAGIPGIRWSDYTHTLIKLNLNQSETTAARSKQA